MNFIIFDRVMSGDGAPKRSREDDEEWLGWNKKLKGEESDEEGEEEDDQAVKKDDVRAWMN